MMCTFVILLMVINVQKTSMTVGVTGFKIGVIMDEDFDQDSLREAVNRMIEFHADLTTGKDKSDVLGVVWITLNSVSTSDVVTVVCKALNKRTRALISALRCPQRRTVAAIAESFQIPHLSVDLDPCPSSSPETFTVRLSSKNHDIATLLVDITRATRCKEVALITDDASVHSLRQSLIVQLSLVGVQAILVSLSSNGATDWPGIPKKVVVITGSRKLLKFLQQEEDWRRDHHVWAYVTDLCDPGLLEQLLKPYKNINIVLVNPKPIFLSTNSRFPCIQSEKKLTLLGIQLLEAVHMLRRAFNVIVNATLLNHHDPFCSIGQLLPFDGGVQLLEQLKVISNTEECSMCDGLNPPGDLRLFAVPAGPDRRLKWVGQWSERTRLTLHHTSSSNSLLGDHQADFNGITLRVATDWDSYPYVGRASSGNGSYKGITIDMLNDLANSLNFRYVLVESMESYGVNLNNGSWSGMIGMVIRGEVDLVASPVTVTLERLKVVDFTTPFIQDSLGIMTPRPSETTDLFQLLNPLSLQVWLSLLGFFLLAVVITACITVTTGFPWSCACRDGSSQQSIADNIILLISAFFQQGPTFHPTSVSARCFLSFWCIFTILTMTMYTAHLAAVLTVSTPVRPINSLQDLVDQTEFGILVSPGTSTWDLFKWSNLSLYKHIAERMKPVESVGAAAKGLLDGRYSYIGDASILEFWEARACGQIRLADEHYHGFSYAFVLPKGSPYKHAIDIKIQKMVEAGVVVGLKKKWLSHPGNCTHYKTGSAVRLGLDRIGGVFILYTGVGLIAALVLLAERTYFKLTRTNVT